MKNTGIRLIHRAFLTSSLILMALSGTGFAQSTPNVTAFSFTPSAINTSASSANVTLNFTLTDTGSGVSYFETGFQDPSAAFIRRVSKSFSPPGTPITSSILVTFPQFTEQGTWTVAYIFLVDASGNSLFIDTSAIAARGFPTTLLVSSAVDNTAPNLTALSFSPGSINTTSAAANVTVNFALSDDLSGANSFQITFVSPSGATAQTGSASFPAATVVSNSATVAFPRFSESGTWTVSTVSVNDAAGNALILGPTDLAGRGFPSTLSVTSTIDTTPPNLTAFSFTPSSINVTSVPATVTVNFQATDNLSGVTNIQVNFLSPSGALTQTAGASFTSNTSVTGSGTATFPRLSESGTWIVNGVLVTDASGNTQSLATSDLAARGFPTQLNVINTNPASNPPVIVPTVSPAPGSSGWNTTVPVTVSWSVTDPTGIASSTGCGTATVSTETSGTIFTCSATNVGGLTSSNAVTVRIDTRPPTVIPTVTPTPNAAGWNNSGVTLTWSVIDTISGINPDLTAGCDPVTLTTETAGTTITCTGVDGAGVSVSVSVTIKIDMTRPTATAAASPAPNGAGWNSTNVTVTFTGSDALSGIASCTAPVVLSSEGTGQSASGFCTDNAGNASAFATASGINIDKTPPVVVATLSPAPNSAGWNNTSPVTVSWSVTEPSPGSSVTSTSGCTSSTVSTETAGTTFTCSATNIAGLTSTVSTTVKLDTSPPVIVPNVSPAPNIVGWNNSNVTVTFAVSDPISGIASSTGCAATTISTETAGTVVTCTATNAAGLSSSASVTIKLDKTAPASNANVTPNPVEINVASTLTATITDALSGVASADYNIDGGAFIPLSATFGGTSVNVSVAIAAYTAPGLHDLCVRGTDVAGNVGTPDCVVLAVFNPDGGFSTGGGGTNSPTLADSSNPAGTGPVTFGFNVKYLPNATTPSGNVEFHYNAGNINFNSTGFDFLVVTSEPRAQIQGTGTINGSTVCSFTLDAWQGSFQPGNVDAFGLRIYDCAGGSGDRYNLVTRPTTKGSIKIHP